MPGSRFEMNPKREVFLNKYSNLADAFNRLRISSPTVVFDSQLQYGLNLETWYQKKSTSATITHLSSEASVQLTVPANSLTAIRQTREYFRYQPGKSQLILATFGSGESQTGVNKLVGYGDANNGIFFKSDGDGYYFIRRSDTSGTIVDTAIEQADWNIDKLDGGGPSRHTMDFSKVQIFLTDLEWLGVGRVRCGFVLDGTIVYAHEFLQANVGTEVYMKTANLPIRYELQSTAATSSASLKQICASVMSEGGESIPGVAPRSISNDNTLIAITSEATNRAVLTIRPRTTFLGQPNRVYVVPRGINIFSEDQDVHYHVVFGGVLTNATSTIVWNPVSTAYSAVDYAVPPAATVVGGIELEDGYVAAQTLGGKTYGGTEIKSFDRAVPLTLDIDGGHPTSGVTNQLSIVAGSLGADAQIGAVIAWDEDR
jgi:hypothetical protein